MIAAPPLAGATIDRALINSFYIDDKQLQTVKFTIGRNSQLIGKPLGSLQEQHRLRILSHRRHNQEVVLFPPDETMLQENDRIAILAQSAVIGHLHTLNQDRPK